MSALLGSGVVLIDSRLLLWAASGVTLRPSLDKVGSVGGLVEFEASPMNECGEAMEMIGWECSDSETVKRKLSVKSRTWTDPVYSGCRRRSRLSLTSLSAVVSEFIQDVDMCARVCTDPVMKIPVHMN